MATLELNALELILNIIKYGMNVPGAIIVGLILSIQLYDPIHRRSLISGFCAPISGLSIEDRTVGNRPSYISFGDSDDSTTTEVLSRDSAGTK